MDFPKTKKDNVADSIHGISVADPYRWLEDGDSKEVKEWVEEQGRYTDSFLRNKTQALFSDELATSYKTTTVFTPTVINGRYFYTEIQPGEESRVLYVKRGIDGNPLILLDPNEKDETGKAPSLDYWSPSATGKYMLCGLSYGGDEMSTMYIIDADTGERLQESIPNCRYSRPQWLPDDSGFFYKKNPAPGEVPKGENQLHVKVYFHSIGTDPDQDELIFGDGRPKDDMINLNISPDGRYLAIYVSNNWVRNDIYLYDNQEKITRALIIGIDAQFSFEFLHDKVLLVTNHKANNYRVLSASYEDMHKNIDEWKLFIPEKDYPLKGTFATFDKVILVYQKDVSSLVIAVDHDGNEQGTIPLPPYSTVLKISSRVTEREFFYPVTSFLFPRVVYRYCPDDDTYVHYKATESRINPADYVVSQEWCASKDGIKVPMFIVRKKDIVQDGVNPTIMYGYGGFGSSQTPFFLRDLVPWLERGGIYVVTNIRGGAEFGTAWHQAAIKENKQKSYDDFIACAEHLVAQKYTNPEHLGITGRSNGGLLVAAVAVQRPDLFGAVQSAVPLIDMVRFSKKGMAMRWVHEFGDPNIKADLEKILSWSPYHNVHEGVEYPPTLFTTAENDTRVDPYHARKMAALLQSVNKKNKILLYTEKDAGHMSTMPISKMVEAQSLVLTFFAHELGLTI